MIEAMPGKSVSKSGMENKQDKDGEENDLDDLRS